MQMQASPARADAYRNRPRYRDREGQPAQHHNQGHRHQYEKPRNDPGSAFT